MIILRAKASSSTTSARQPSTLRLLLESDMALDGVSEPVERFTLGLGATGVPPSQVLKARFGVVKGRAASPLSDGERDKATGCATDRHAAKAAADADDNADALEGDEAIDEDVDNDEEKPFVEYCRIIERGTAATEEELVEIAVKGVESVGVEI